MLLTGLRPCRHAFTRRVRLTRNAVRDGMCASSVRGGRSSRFRTGRLEAAGDIRPRYFTGPSNSSPQFNALRQRKARRMAGRGSFKLKRGYHGDLRGTEAARARASVTWRRTAISNGSAAVGAEPTFITCGVSVALDQQEGTRAIRAGLNVDWLYNGTRRNSPLDGTSNLQTRWWPGVQDGKRAAHPPHRYNDPPPLSGN